MNVLSTPSQSANLSLHGHDMSQLNKFSSTTGELLPFYYEILYPKDKVRVSCELKSRTQPIQSAAMVSLTEHLDWFAVPLDQLYHFFSQQYYGILDNHSSIFDDIVSPDFPTLSIRNLRDFFSNFIMNTDAYFNGSNIEGKSLSGTGVRFLEFLDIPLNDWNDSVNNSFGYSINPFLIAAYQKIYMDYFRLTDREINNPKAYNLDEYYNQSDINGDFLDSACFLRYRPKRKDFFTHLYVSPLFPSAGVGVSDSQDLLHQYKQWLIPTDYTETPDATAIISSTNGTLALQKSLSPQAIRTSFALSKLLEVTRRAGKHIDQQTLAHFGVKPNKFVTGEVRHLAHHSQKLVIGDVISTAETNEAALGQVGGKGYGYGRSSAFTYKNEEACPVILMGIYSAEVDMDYKVTGLGRFNTYVSFADFYNPAFDNLGMQPLFAYQSFLNPIPAAYDTWNNTVLGWQYRWMESKCKHNRILGNLAREMEFWSVYTEYMTSNLSSFLVSPFALDSIMVTPYEFDAQNSNTLAPYGLNPGTDDYIPSNAFDRDPLFHELYVDCKKSSTMSTFGLEQL